MKIQVSIDFELLPLNILSMLFLSDQTDVGILKINDEECR